MNEERKSPTQLDDRTCRAHEFAEEFLDGRVNAFMCGEGDTDDVRVADEQNTFLFHELLRETDEEVLRAMRDVNAITNEQLAAIIAGGLEDQVH
jgi:hypothetical protein